MREEKLEDNEWMRWEKARIDEKWKKMKQESRKIVGEEDRKGGYIKV